MEDWIKVAKDRAKSEAECFIENMKDIAEEEEVEPIWFIEEVIKNVHNLKDKI